MTRDHRATLGDDEMCKTLYKAHPAMDQALNQMQRDMARPYSQEATGESLNSMFLAFAQIQERLREYVDRGQTLVEKEKQLK